MCLSRRKVLVVEEQQREASTKNSKSDYSRRGNLRKWHVGCSNRTVFHLLKFRPFDGLPQPPLIPLLAGPSQSRLLITIKVCASSPQPAAAASLKSFVSLRVHSRVHIIHDVCSTCISRPHRPLRCCTGPPLGEAHPPPCRYAAGPPRWHSRRPALPPM